MDGTGLTCGDVREITHGGVQVAISPAAMDQARLAHEAVLGAVISRPVYGCTTGVGANHTGQPGGDAAAPAAQFTGSQSPVTARCLFR